MPLPYGPEPTADKPSAKAHPSSLGAHSLVIRTEAAAGAGKGEENGKVEVVLVEKVVGGWMGWGLG